MKDTLSRILAALAIFVGTGALAALFVVWTMLEGRGDMLAGQLKGQDDRIAAIEGVGSEAAQEETAIDTRPFMPPSYQGTLPSNHAPASETVEYRDTDIGLTFRVPYNPAWGDRDYRVTPYDTFWYPENDTRGIHFGAAGQWEGGGWARGYSLLVKPAMTAEQAVQDIAETEGDFLEEPVPEIRTVGGKQVVVFYGGGLCSYVHVLVIGEKYNYLLTPLCGDDNSILDALFRMVESMEFIR